MLQKKNRLTKNQFTDSFRSGKRYHTPFFQLIFDSKTPDFHGAVVVGKKVYKKAVDRNKVRRRIYNVVYRRQDKQLLVGTFILVAKPTIKSLTKKALLEETNKVLNLI